MTPLSAVTESYFTAMSQRALENTVEDSGEWNTAHGRQITNRLFLKNWASILESSKKGVNFISG